VGLFGKKGKQREVKIRAPLSGKIIPLEKVPDPVFAQKMMGEGIAIEPTEGEVVAPFAGEVLTCFPHALGIKSEEGLELLIHVGIDTVKFKGEGSEKLVNQGDKVEEGKLLIKFNLDYYRKNAPSLISPLVITNMQIVSKLNKSEVKDVTAGEEIILRALLKE